MNDFTQLAEEFHSTSMHLSLTIPALEAPGEQTMNRGHDPLMPCEGSREPCPVSVSRETETLARLLKHPFSSYPKEPTRQSLARDSTLELGCFPCSNRVPLPKYLCCTPLQGRSRPRRWLVDD